MRLFLPSGFDPTVLVASEKQLRKPTGAEMRQSSITQTESGGQEAERLSPLSRLTGRKTEDSTLWVRSRFRIRFPVQEEVTGGGVCEETCQLSSCRLSV